MGARMLRKGLAVAVVFLFFGVIVLSSTSKMTFDEDTTPPVTTHEFTGMMGDNDWYVSDVTITLIATDDISGVNVTYYSFDGVDFDIYEFPIIVTDDGEFELYYYSIDNSGNTEDVKGPFDFKIDQTPPTIYLSWDDENKLLIADVYDETSGVAKVEFYVNTEFVGEVTEPPWQWYYPNATSGDIAEAIAYDVAGNPSVSTSPPPRYGMIGLICNRKFDDGNVSFYAIIVRTRNPYGWEINQEVTMPDNYEGRIGLFFINARW